MNIEIRRTYYPEGTNGSLFINGILQCFTIELPWLENRHGLSCIPEGNYEICARRNRKFGNHFEIMGVPDRSAILIHPANDALKQLKGCIAPVSHLVGPGQGEYSRDPLKHLCEIIYPELEQQKVLITIKSKNNDNHTKDPITNAAFF